MHCMLVCGSHEDLQIRNVPDDLACLDLERHPHGVLLPAIWAMRENLTAYDAAYVSLADVLAAPLRTLDAGLAAAPGRTVRVELVT